MPTKLAEFCQHFDQAVRPLLPSLDAAREASQGADVGSLPVDLAGLRDELAGLVAKVAGQQAYVLIFGPLKSGKSTLMNALAASYVSEVSSLPAYPCLVFVGHGARREWIATAYDGSTEAFADVPALRDRIEQAHRDLAARIRASEGRDDEFDPEAHFQAAIRRVDVRLPSPALAAANAVLVDTPGLYTRMRLRYDRLTRDFRRAAACAVFVVKTDNLFLEQAFAEFHELLALFCRVFLVVNVDATKRDVGPDGELVPSLEQRQPERIVQAFQELAMSAPLQRAVEAGRLRLYPVDLLHAASAVLRGAADAEVPDGFRRFRDDLQAHLASAEHLLAFVHDSLQRAHALLGELDGVVAGESASGLRADLRDAARQRDAAQSDLDGVAAVLAHLAGDAGTDAAAMFARSRQEVEGAVQRTSFDHGGRSLHAMGAALDHWFLSSHALSALLGDFDALLAEHRRTVLDAAYRAAEPSALAPDGGLQDDPAVLSFLHRLGIDVGGLRRDALAAARTQAERAMQSEPATRVPLDAQAIPIRRGVLDVLALRSEDAVRRRLIGAADRLDRKIQASAKKARLGEPAKTFLRDALLRCKREVLPRFAEDALRCYRDELQAATVQALSGALRERDPELRQRIARLDAEAARLRAVLAPLEQLQAAGGEVHGKVRALSAQYAHVDPAQLLERERDAVLEPQPPVRTDERARRGRAGRRAET